MRPTKWLALPTYAVALVLLLVVGAEAWAILVFPAWVFVVSACILVVSRRGGVEDEMVTGGEAPGPSGA